MTATSWCLRLSKVLVMAAVCLGVPAQAQAERSGVGPCRQGVVGLIGMLDAGVQATANYRTAARDVVESCGAPAGRASGPARIDPAVCRPLAVQMLDAIEDGKMNPRLSSRRGIISPAAAPRQSDLNEGALPHDTTCAGALPRARRHAADERSLA